MFMPLNYILHYNYYNFHYCWTIWADWVHHDKQHHKKLQVSQRWCADVQTRTLTELAALSDEARPAGTQSAHVVAVRSVLTATHLGALGSVETRGTAWRGTHINKYSCKSLLEPLSCIGCSALQTQDLRDEPQIWRCVWKQLLWDWLICSVTGEPTWRQTLFAVQADLNNYLKTLWTGSLSFLQCNNHLQQTLWGLITCGSDRFR